MRVSTLLTLLAVSVLIALGIAAVAQAQSPVTLTTEKLVLTSATTMPALSGRKAIETSEPRAQCHLLRAGGLSEGHRRQGPED